MVRAVLSRRLSEDSWASFLEARLSQLQDPFLLPDVDIAVERLKKALLNQEKICVYADFDLDGSSGLALVIETLSQWGFRNLVPYQPRRLREGYGFHASAVDEVHSQGATLILTIDVGITSVLGCARARELGLDVILTDHHQAGERLPEAMALVNPNLPKFAGQHELRYLCGCGVAFYLLRALRRHLDSILTEEAKAWSLKNVLDYVALATVTDMVPLLGDNRPLVKHGLLQMQKTTHAGFRALLDALNLGGKRISSQDLGIKFAPKINALSRMDSDLLPWDLMKVRDLNEAKKAVDRVLVENKNRVELQGEAQTLAHDLAEKFLQDNEGFFAQGRRFIFIFHPSFHRGVVGLVAQNLAQQFGVSAFVGSLSEEEGVVVGSARSLDVRINLVRILGLAAENFERFGGHKSAAGFEFASKNFDSILKNLFQKSWEVEDSLILNEEVFNGEEFVIDSQFLRDLEILGPFGQGFEEPIFSFEGKISKGLWLKDKHFKFSFSTRSFVVSAIYFSCSKDKIDTALAAERIQVLGRVQRNEFWGRAEPQLLVEEIHVLD